MSLMIPSPFRSRTSHASSLCASVHALSVRWYPGRVATSTPSSRDVKRNPSPAMSSRMGDVQQHGLGSALQLHRFLLIDPSSGAREHAADSTAHANRRTIRDLFTGVLGEG